MHPSHSRRFDIISFDFDGREDEEGMLKTVPSINDIISTEITSGLPASRIILGGFSQGGSTSLLTGLTSEKKIGGVAVLSGWLPLSHKFKEVCLTAISILNRISAHQPQMSSEHATQTPLFWGHGTDDPLIKYKFGTASVEYLTKTLGFKPVTDSTIGVDFRSYKGMGHSTCQTELDDLRAWIKRVVPKDSE
jgi:predicted esterase